MADEDSDGARAELEQELADVRAEIGNLLRRDHTWVFPLGLGRRKLRAFLGPGHLFLLFAGIHLIAGLAGVVLTLKGNGRNADLGVALLVGALFGLGAFLAEECGREAWANLIGFAKRSMARTIAGRFTS